MWRERVQGRKTKHNKKRGDDVDRFKCSRQKQITHNKISMELADQLMGVTMHEPGVSRLVSVDVDEAAELAAS